MRSGRTSVLLFCGLAVLLAGCAPAAQTSPNPGLLTADSRPEAVREALIDGVVSVEGDCFILSADGERWLIEWPYGSTLGPDEQSVEVEGFGAVRVGDRVTGGGGYSDQTDGCSATDVEGTASIDTVTDTQPE
ncbi:hypothetical protein [Microbacterium sp. W4I20]|uniref:hypothetical protein n=1 Tax=Microbacterium sp. W4I20 TaxID=3042262 RepID=UPI00278A8C08|nr:hypothetical protein [Microbacterium sp. W4I20]MDQ0727529.1 hypothetical protein [Microbacterium sp. W4I20]